MKLILLLSTILLSSNLYALGHYVRSEDGSSEWVDDIRVLSQNTCVTSRGGHSTIINGRCLETIPDTQYSDPSYRMMADYLATLGQAAMTEAINSKFPDSVSSSYTSNPISLDNNSNSSSQANSRSNSKASASARARAQQNQNQGQGQTQGQIQGQLQFIGNP